jgi:hypothetical protein
LFLKLSYTFNERAMDEAQMREIARKAKKVVGCVWEKERKGRRMMFESMVESVLMYRAEIWGWKEQEEVEIVQEECGGSESGKESGKV